MFENFIQVYSNGLIGQKLLTAHPNILFVQILPDVLGGTQLRILDLGNNCLETLSKIHVCVQTVSGHFTSSF